MQTMIFSGVFAVFALVSVPTLALAQTQSGTYTGTLTCGELLESPSRPGWSDKVQIEINGSQLTWSRAGTDRRGGSSEYREFGTSYISSLDTSFVEAEGRYLPGSSLTGSWITRGEVRIEGGRIIGERITQTDPNRMRIFRHCTASIPVRMNPDPTIGSVASQGQAAPKRTPAPIPAPDLQKRALPAPQVAQSPQAPSEGPKREIPAKPSTEAGNRPPPAKQESMQTSTAPPTAAVGNQPSPQSAPPAPANRPPATTQVPPQVQARGLGSVPTPSPAISATASAATSGPNTTTPTTIVGSWICNEGGEDRPTQLFDDGTFMVYSEQQRGHQLFASGTYALQGSRLEMVTAIGRLVKVTGEEVFGWDLSTHGRPFGATNFRWFTYSVSALTPDRIDRTQIKGTTGPGETQAGPSAAATFRVRSEPTNCRRTTRTPLLESQRQAVPAALYTRLRAVVALGNNKGPAPYPQAEYDIGALVLVPASRPESPICARQIQPWISAATRLFESGEKLQKLGQQAAADNLFRQASEIADDKIRRAGELGCG